MLGENELKLAEKVCRVLGGSLTDISESSTMHETTIHFTIELAYTGRILDGKATQIQIILFDLDEHE